MACLLKGFLMLLNDEARCANEDCPSKAKCDRYSEDGNAYYANFAIGIDDKCDGFRSKPKPRCVILKPRVPKRLRCVPRN